MNGGIQLKIKIKENLFGKITVKMEGTWEEFAPFIIKPKTKAIYKKNPKTFKDQMDRGMTLVQFMRTVNHENVFISKKEFIENYQKIHNVSLASTYERFRKVQANFDSRKEGRSVFIKLRD